MAEDQSFEIEAISFALILTMYVLTSHLIQIKNVPYIHESTIAILMGLLVGIFAKYGFGKEFQFSSEFFFTIALPPIIFSAGYSLRKSLFFENFSIIGYLGIVGSIIGFILISSILYAINLIFGILTIEGVLMISAIFCATDTIAANSLIKAEKYPILNAVLFSQGIINDAIGIILFRTVESLHLNEQSGQFTFTTVLQMIFNFCYLLVFSLLLGLLFGFSLSYLFKINQSFIKYPLKQTSLILLNGYISYLLGEIVGLSGIITLFTCAIIMGHYSFMNLSEESQRGTGLAFETVSCLSQAFIYAYLGASLVSIQMEWNVFGQAIMLLAFLPLVRAVMVYLLPAIYHCIKRPFPLNDKELKVCWFSGMIRGAIAFALSLQIEGPDKNPLKIISITIALFTTVFGSSFLRSFASWVGIEAGNDSESSDLNNFLIEEKIKEEDYHKEGLGFESEDPKQNEIEYEYRRKKLLQKSDSQIKPIEKKQHLNFQLSQSFTNDRL